jgi:hypothetical protein
VHEIKVNFVPGAASHPNPVCAKGRVEAASAGSLIITDIEHEIVLDNVIVSADQINSLSRQGLDIVASHTANLVLLYRVSASRRGVDTPNTDGGIRAESIGGNPTFHVDDVATNYPGQRVRRTRALRSDADRINLVRVARCRVANEVVFDQQTREHARVSSLNSDRPGGCHDVVVLYSQIVGRCPGADGCGNIGNRRGRSPGSSRCAAVGQETVSRVFRPLRRCCGADVSAGRVADQVQVLNGVVIGVIVTACCQRNANY